MPELARSEWEHLFEPWFANEGHGTSPAVADREESVFHEASQPLAVRRKDYVRRQSPVERALELRSANVNEEMERLLAYAERRHLGVEVVDAGGHVERPGWRERAIVQRQELLPVVSRPPVISELPDADRAAKARRPSPPGIGPFRGLLAFASIALIAVYVVYVQRSAEAAMSRATAAERTATEVQRSAHDAVTAAADRAQKAIADALTQASRAERMIEVMAAPDARRIELSGRGAAPAALGQALYSRSRGVILSVTDLPRPADGQVFQVWATTSTGSVSLGLATPDAQGRIAGAYELPQGLAGSIRGFMLTQERVGGGSAPGEVMLAAR